MWHVTGDTWHVTRDTWHVHVIRDMFGGVNILSKFQLPSFYRLWFTILWRSGGKGSLTYWINDEAVYRTAPATPGLLKEITQPLRKKSCNFSGQKKLRNLSTKKSSNLSGQKKHATSRDKNHATSQDKKITQPLKTKISRSQ